MDFQSFDVFAWIVLPRKDLHEVIQIIHEINPKTFFSVEEVRSTSEGIFRLRRTPSPHIKPPHRKHLQFSGWRIRK